MHINVPGNTTGPLASMPSDDLRKSSSFKYKAFISYRHVAQDRRMAKWLQQSLETYRPPPPLIKKGIPPRLGKVFRDEEELAASSDLSKSISNALNDSEWLVVVCSPRAKLSLWINQEVVEFRKLGRSDRILSYLIDGEPSEAFPSALYEIRSPNITSADKAVRESSEPLAADARTRSSEWGWTTRRKAKLKLLARFLDCDYDDLKRREGERRLRRALFSSILGGIVLAIFTALSVLAITSEQRADTESQNRRRTAYFNVIRLADEARQQALLPRMAFLLESAEPRDRGWEWDRLNYVAHRARNLGGDFKWINNVAISPDGCWIAVAGDRNGGPKVIIWRRGTQEIYHEINLTSASINKMLRFSPDSSRLVLSTGNTPSIIGHELDGLWVFDLESRKFLLSLPKPSHGRFWAVAVDSKLRSAVTFEQHASDSGGTIQLWDTSTGKLLDHADIPIWARYLFLSSDSSRLLVVSIVNPGQEYRLQRWTTRPLAAESSSIPVEANSLTSPFPDLSEILGTDKDDFLTAWNSVSGTMRRLYHERLNIGQVIFDADGRWAATVRKSINSTGLDHGERVLIFSADRKEPVELPWEDSNVLYGSAPINGAHLDGIELSPSGRFLLVPRGSSQQESLPPRAQVFNVLSGRQTATIAGNSDTGWGLRSAFLQDDQLLVSTARNTLAVYDLSTGREVTVLLGHDVGDEYWINDLRTSESGRYAVSSDRRGQAYLWELPPEESQALILKGETFVKALAWSGDGEQIVVGGSSSGPGSGSRSGLVEIWKVSTQERERKFFAQDFSIEGMASIANTNYIVTHDSFDSVNLWNFANGEKIRDLQPGQQLVDPVILSQDQFHSSFPVYSREFRAVDCSRDGSMCAASGLRDGAIRFWAPARSDEILLWRPFGSIATTVAFSADSHAIVAGGAKGEIKFAKLAPLREIWSVKVGEFDISSLATDPKGRWVAAGLSDGSLALVELEHGKVLFRINGHLAKVSDLDFEPTKGERLASASHDGTIKIWDCTLGLETLALIGHTAAVEAISFHPHGHSLASGGVDQTVRIWQTSQYSGVEDAMELTTSTQKHLMSR